MSAPRLPAFQIEPHPSQQRSRGLSKHRNADRGPAFQELLLALCKFGMLDGPWWPSLAWPPAPLSHSLAFLSSADGQGLGSFPCVVPGLGTSRPGLSSQTSDAAPPPFPQGSFPDLLAPLLSRAPFLLHSLCYFPSGPLSLCTHGTATCCHLPSPVNTPPWTVSMLTLSPLLFPVAGSDTCWVRQRRTVCLPKRVSCFVHEDVVLGPWELPPSRARLWPVLETRRCEDPAPAPQGSRLVPCQALLEESQPLCRQA